MRATKRRPGRPSIRTRAIENKICDRIACGESLRSICADKSMPAKSTFFRWLAKDAARARQWEIIRKAMLAEGLIQPGQTS